MRIDPLHQPRHINNIANLETFSNTTNHIGQRLELALTVGWSCALVWKKKIERKQNYEGGLKKWKLCSNIKGKTGREFKFLGECDSINTSKQWALKLKVVPWSKRSRHRTYRCATITHISCRVTTAFALCVVCTLWVAHMWCKTELW